MSRAMLLLGAAVAFAGCAETAGQPPREVSAYQHEQATTCPMAFPGTEMLVTHTPNGVALVFTTDSGDADDLRARVHQEAERYRVLARSGGPVPGAEQACGPSQEGPWAAGGLGGQTGFGRQGPINGPPVTTPDPPEAAETCEAESGKVPYFVYVEDIDHGARLVFTPRRLGELGALRSEVQRQARLMQAGECPAAL